MELYKLNVEQSTLLYKEQRSLIIPKQCYNNIFNLCIPCIKYLKSGEWKIAYGYVSSVPSIYCRHCFFFDGTSIIDPTVFATKTDNTNRLYYVTKIFDTTDEYVAALLKDKQDPTLARFLRAEDAEAQLWASQNGCFFVE